MTRTSAPLALLAVIALSVLTACSAPAPVAPEPKPAPPTVDGSWTATRTLTETTVTNEGLVVGTVEARTLELSDSACGDDGVCTGGFTSAVSADPADQATAIPGEFTWDGEALTLSVRTTTDCNFTDGTVAFADAFVVETTYDLSVAEGDAERVTAFTGTVTAVISTVEEAIATGCPESAGERHYDVDLIPTV